jgi:hypothetical protein
MKQFIFFSLIAILFFAACKPKPIRISIPEETPKLSVFTFSIPEGGMLLGLTKTFTTLGSNNIFDDTTGAGEEFFRNHFIVDHAYVQVKYNGIIDTFINVGDGIYFTPDSFKFITNMNYELEVYDSITQQRISAYSIAQAQITLDTLVVTKKISNNDSVFTFNYRFKDDKTLDNYYMINVVNSSGENGFNFNNSFKGKPDSYLELISDKTAQLTDINGTNFVTINGNFNMSTFKNKMTTTDTLVVSVSAIDKSYYEFLSVYKRNGSIINQLTGEPINLPTNVKNGFGYFSTHFASYSDVDLNEL